MNEIQKDRQDQLVQELLAQKAQLIKAQSETGKNYSSLIKQIDQQIKDCLRGIKK